jgi:hypothetical protein
MILKSTVWGPASLSMKLGVEARDDRIIIFTDTGHLDLSKPSIT